MTSEPIPAGRLGWDADGMCDDHYRFACPKCAIAAAPTSDSAPAGDRSAVAEVGLLPCPFGCNGVLYFDEDGDEETDPRFWVECPTCCARGPEWSVADRAIDGWNTRSLSVNEMAAFGASDAACYLYPGEGQMTERAAFCAGAAHAAPPSDSAPAGDTPRSAPEVTQADRETAAAIYRKMGQPLSHLAVATGLADDNPIVLAFARPRASSEAVEQSEVSRLREAEKRDAARWRALWSSDRIRMMGCAGFDFADDGTVTPRAEGGQHMGVEVWDKHPAQGDNEDSLGRKVLLAYVDARADLSGNAS